jgi:1,4-dihydroxy-2-naphthoate polyprenyltransferase
MVGLYAAGAGIGLVLAILRGFWPLALIGATGIFISLAYTAPPLRLVHRGIGEICVGLGFGPIMTIGAYYVQAQRWSWEPVYASLPVGILIALILYVNEVPDRVGDARSGKRTLPVRLSEQNVVRGYDLAVAVTFALIAAFAISGVIVRPAIIALAALPLAFPVRQALRDSYENPYALMPAMAKNIQLHVVAGLLLVAGYVIAIVADAAFDDPPFFLS